LPQLNPGRPAPAVTVETFARIYLTEIIALMKPAAARSASSIIVRHVIPLLGHYRLEEISGGVPQAFVAQLHGRELARKSIINALVVLAGMLDHALEQNYRGVQRLSRASLKLPPPDLVAGERWYLPEESAKVIDAAEGQWRVLYAMMAYMGLRIAEALGLTWQHVDLEARIVRIRQAVVLGRVQTLKSKNSQADLPLPETLGSILGEYRKSWRPNDHGLLFVSRNGGPLWADSVRQYQLAPLLARLGLKRGGFHAFRHGVATNLFAAGAAPPTVRAMLRHARLETTMGYTHTVLEDARLAIEGSSDRIDRHKAAAAA
jgi:integrase